MPADSRNIVLFSDGTGNSSASLFKTNVRRLFEALDVADPANPMHPRQFAFYDDGVGSSSFKPFAVVGGAFGFGLTRNVRDLYAALCRTYRPGDKIFGFGFSRGAFTIRVLVGVIMNQGIVRYEGDEQELKRRVKQAVRAYRREKYSRVPIIFLLKFMIETTKCLLRTRLDEPVATSRQWDARAARWCFPGLAYSKADNYGAPPEDASATPGDKGLAWFLRRAFPAQFPSPNAEDAPHEPQLGDEELIKVDFLGLWDTVDAYGLPIDELTWAVDRLIWPLTMSDAVLCERVERACHALSLDDERQTFHPRLWTEPEGQTPPLAEPHLREERITQVWFAGVHADLGGGYPDDSLAHTSLLWMTGHAQGCGLRFMPAMRAQHRALSDENGFLHDSRRGLAGYYRYMPRDVAALCDQAEEGTWHPRVRVELPKVHESVFRRMGAGTNGYAPLAVPEKFEVVRVRSGEQQGTDSDRPALQDGDMYLSRQGNQPAEYTTGRQRVWNWVWWRRVAYFATLAATLALLSMPFVLEPSACVSVGCAVSPLFSLLGLVLPGTTSTWLGVFASHPFIALSLLSVVGAGLLTGGWLETRIFDRMRRVWYAYTPRVSTELGPVAELTPEPLPPGGLNYSVQWLRLSPSYRLMVDIGRRWVLPPGAALLAFYLVAGLVNMGLLSFLEASGANCRAEGKPVSLPLGQSAVVAFATTERCQSMQVKLEEGVHYRLEVGIGADRWVDDTVPAGPNGLDWSNVGAIQQTWFGAAVPFRRHVGEPWFKLMARIGERGRVVHSPDWRLVPDREGVERYEAVLEADRTGPLFLYVNDALPVVYWPWAYNNNHGTAEVKITAVSAERP